MEKKKNEFERADEYYRKRRQQELQEKQEKQKIVSADEYYRKENLYYKIVKTKIISQGPRTLTTKGSVVSMATRGLVGSALLGGAGAIIGAATHKRVTVEKQEITFLVLYADGHKAKEVVQLNSQRYNQLIKYL